jgi:hypothetical protein
LRTALAPCNVRRLVTGSDREPTLSAVLDEIIPPSGDGTLPGAGTLGVAGHIAQAIERTPELEFTIAPGLAAADDLANERHGRGFAELPREQKLAVLSALDATQPAFIPTLTFHAYIGYYQHPRVIAGLGLEPRPPHPQGYVMEPNDLSLLDPVRQRPRMYRGG